MGEHLSFLWNRLAAGDPQLKGEGSFVAPFLTESEYFKHLAKGFGRIEEKYLNKSRQAMIDGVDFDEAMPYSKKLKALYFHKWAAPEYAGFEIATHAKKLVYLYDYWHCDCYVDCYYYCVDCAMAPFENNKFL